MAKKESKLRYEPLYKPSWQRQKDEVQKKSSKGVWIALMRYLTFDFRKERRQ